MWLCIEDGFCCLLVFELWSFVTGLNILWFENCFYSLTVNRLGCLRTLEVLNLNVFGGLKTSFGSLLCLNLLCRFGCFVVGRFSELLVWL